MSEIVNNQSYVVKATDNTEIIVPVGEKIEYPYNDTEKIYLMGYDTSNYHEYISKSLMSLSKSVINLETIGSSEAINEINSAKDDAIVEIKNSTSNIQTEIVTLAEETVYKSMDNVESNVNQMKDAVDNTEQEILNINSKIGAIDGSTGVFHDINILNNNIFNDDNGLIKKLEDLTTKINNFPEFGSFDSSSDSLNNGLVPLVLLNKSFISQILENLSDIDTSLNNQVNGTNTLVSENKTSIENLNNVINDETDGIATKMNYLYDNLSSILNFDLTSIAEISTNVTQLLNTVNDTTDKTGLTSNVKTNKDDIDIIKTNIGSLSEKTGIYGDIDSIKSSLGTSTTAGILKDLKDLKDLNLDAVATSVSGADGLVIKFNNIVSDTITPAVNTILTADDNLCYNGQKIKDTFDSLNATDIENLKTKFNEYFQDADGNYLTSAQAVGNKSLSIWLADDTENGFVSLVKGITPYSQGFLDLVKYTEDLKDVVDAISVPSTDDVATAVISNFSENNVINNVVDTELATFKTNDVDPITGLIDATNTSVNSISEVTLKNATKFNKEIDNINQEAMKYLAFMPWLKDILKGIADGSKTSDDIETDFNDKLLQLEEIILNNLTNDTTIKQVDDKLAIVISLDSDVRFDDDAFVIASFVGTDDTLYFLKYTLTDEEKASGEVYREVDSIILSDSDGNELTLTNVADVYSNEVTFIFGQYNIVLDEPVATAGKSSDAIYN